MFNCSPVQWDNTQETLHKIEQMFLRSVYGCQASPDGTLVVWNKETADAIDRVECGHYVWLYQGVMFRSKVCPTTNKVLLTVGQQPSFDEWLAGGNGMTREQGYYRLVSVTDLLRASIQNPAPTAVLMQQFSEACEMVANAIQEVGQFVETWGEDNDNSNT